LRLADQLIYTIKPVKGAKTIKMFESQDVKEVELAQHQQRQASEEHGVACVRHLSVAWYCTSLDIDDDQNNHVLIPSKQWAHWPMVSSNSKPTKSNW
jgi:hypothetical protein